MSNQYYNPLSPTLPPWVPPDQANDPGSDDINDAANPLTERLLTLSPTRAIVPLIFGEDITGGILSMFFIVSDYLYQRMVWCIGECEEIVSVELEDGTIPDGAVFTNYLGEVTDGIDPTLGTLIPTYVDTMAIPYNDGIIRLCYSVIKTPIEGLQGFPRYVARIKGLLLRDPRLGATPVYSPTAGLALAHLIENSLYGLGATLDDTSLTALVNINETMLDDGAGFTEPRSVIGLTLKDRRLVSQQIEVLRGYARTRLLNRGGVYYFIPLVAKATTFSIIKQQIISKSFLPRMADLRDVPNTIRVYYTGTTHTPWRDSFVEIRTPEVDAGTESRIEAIYRMNGFQSRTAALRLAYDKINERLRKFSCVFSVTEAIYDREEGETFNLTHPYVGSTTHKMIMIAKRQLGLGVTEIYAQLENDLIYSDEIVDNIDDIGEPPSHEDPFYIPDVFNLELAIETPKYQTSIYFSRIRATWDPTTYSYGFTYHIDIRQNGLLIDNRVTGSNEVVFSNVVENIEYSVEVKIVGFGGTTGRPATAYITPTGKDFVPTDVPWFTGYHFDGKVYFEWGRAADNHSIWYYQIQYGVSGFEWDDGNSRSVIDRIDANSYVASAVPPGTWDFLIKAIDNAGQKSTNAVRISDITVVTSSGAYLVARGSLYYLSSINMVKDNPSDADDDATWVTGTGGTWNTTFPLVWDANYTNIFNTYATGLATEFISESLDVGYAVSGTWQLASNVRISAGTPTITLQLSDDDTIWVDYDNVFSVIASARYIRAKVVGVAADRYSIPSPYFIASINVVTIDESFSGTTDGSGFITFTLSKDASAFESIVASINDLTSNADTVLVAPVEASAPYTQIKCLTLNAGVAEPTVAVSARVRYI